MVAGGIFREIEKKRVEHESKIGSMRIFIDKNVIEKVSEMLYGYVLTLCCIVMLRNVLKINSLDVFCISRLHDVMLSIPMQSR